MDESTLRKLASQFCDRRLSSAELEELDRALASGVVNCRLFLDFCQLHGDLRFAASEYRAVEQFVQSFGLSAAVGQMAEVSAQEAQDTSDRSIGHPSYSFWKRLDKWRWAGIAAAIVIVCGTGIAVLWNGTPLVAKRHAQIVGHLTDGSTAVWAASMPPLLNNVLLEGSSLDLEKGTVRLSLTSGAECALEGPATLHFNSGDNVSLLRGKLTTKVAPWGSGFTVQTDMMQVIDLGTSFTVTADDSKVETSVLEGHVRVRPAGGLKSGRQSLLLAGGEAIRIESLERKLSFPAVQAMSLSDPLLSQLGESSPFHPIVIHNTGVGLDLGDEDSHWRIISGPPAPEFHERQYAVVCELDEHYLANVPGVSQWVSVAEKLPMCEAHSVFTFETKFDLTGFDLSTVVVVGQILADNGVRAVRINGNPVPISPWNDNEWNQLFHKFHRVEIDKGFVAGWNTLQLDVANGIIRWQYDEQNPQPNPMALRAEWQAFGRKAEGSLSKKEK